MTNIEKTVRYTALKIAELMKEEKFENFKEMAECYWWTSTDIREKFESYATDLGLAYIDEVDGSLVIGFDGSEMSYRSYAHQIKKMADRIVNE